MKTTIIKDRSFYKAFFSMFVVLVVQNVITISVNLADNLMLGAYNEAALSGVAAVNQIQFVYQQLLLACGDAIVILGGQYFGKKEYATTKRIASYAMWFGLMIAIVLFIIISTIPYGMMSIFTTDAAIAQQGVNYMAVIRFTYFFFAITQILLATLRSTGVVKIAMYLSISTLIINCCINYVLIYGNFGAPELGVTGAAIGTLTARIIEVVILIIFIRRKEKILHIRLRDYLHVPHGPLLRDYVRLMAPMLFLNSLWGLNNAAQTAILGHMSARAIAANSVSTTLYLAVKSMAMGCSLTASYYVAKTIGENRMDRLKSLAKTMQIIFVCIGIISGIVLFFIRIPILSIYNLDPATKAMANQFLMLLAVIMVFMCYQMPVNMGMIKGGGDIKYCTKMDLISIWAIMIPLSFIMAFVVKAPVIVVVFCLNSDQIFKGIPAFIKINYGNWAHKLTRENPEGPKNAAG